MLGLCAIVLVFLALIGMLSYWISWELQDRNMRPAFVKKLWNDFAGLLHRGESVRLPDPRPATERP